MVAAMFKRTRNLYGSPPSLLAGIPRSTDRDSMLARREALAREEAPDRALAVAAR
jgi:hypothetical protein